MMNRDQPGKPEPDEHADGYMNMRSGREAAVYSHRHDRASANAADHPYDPPDLDDSGVGTPG
jgi:hypothetical protein